MRKFPSGKKALALAVTLAMLLSLVPATALAMHAPANQLWYYDHVGTDGTAESPYIISSADELVGLQGLVNGGNSFENAYIKLATSTSLDLSSYNWTPIGTFSAPFKGSFDGNHATITRLTIDNTQTLSAGQSVCLGLFGDIGVGGSVRDLNLFAGIRVDHNIGSDANANSFVGGIAGMNEGLISGCTVSAVIDVSGIDIMVGGIVGSNGSDSGSSSNTFGVLANNSANCNITAVGRHQVAQVGGIAGISSAPPGPAGIVNQCSSLSTIAVSGLLDFDGTYRCSPDVGGLIGYADNASVTNSASTSVLTVSSYCRGVTAGGLIGRALKTLIEDCSSSGAVSASGGDNPLFADDVAAGGLVGRFSSTPGKIQDCLSTSSAQAQVKSVGQHGYAFAGGLVGYAKEFGGSTEINNSYSTGDTTATALDNGYAYAGGFGGYMWTTSVNSCFSMGNAQSSSASGGSATAGGFTGTLYSPSSASLSNCYSIGTASTNCVTKERVGGLAGYVTGTTSLTNCYSAGHPTTAHTGSAFTIGSSIGTAANPFTLINVYYDSTVNPSLPAIGSGAGTITGLSTDNMTDDTLTSGMSSLLASTLWTKRANTITERYYPELVSFASGAKEAASKASVTVAVPTYALTVNNGSGGGSYAAGASVSITADAAPVGQIFDKWTTSSGGTFANDASATTTFTMPASAVTVTATYKAAAPLTYALTVNNGSGDGSYAAGASVSITADAAPAGQEFDKWTTSSGGTFASDTSTTTTFTMPANAVTVTATYKAQPSSGGGAPAPAPQTASQPLTVLVTTTSNGETSSSASIRGTYSADTHTVTAAIDTELAQDLIDKALAAKAAGEKAIAHVQFGTVEGATAVNVEIPRDELKQMAAAKTALQLDSGIGTITLGARELASITNSKAEGSITLGIEQVDKDGLSAKAQAKIKDSPVYRFSISVGDTEVSRVAGSAQITLPYTPPTGTRPRYVTTYYIDSNNVLRSVRGKYDAKTGTITFGLSRM